MPSKPLEARWLITWSLVGLSLVFHDYLHVLFQATAYAQTKDWGFNPHVLAIPIFTGAGLVFFVLYYAVVGLPDSSVTPSMFGGHPINWYHSVLYFGEFTLAYLVTALFGGTLHRTMAPLMCAVLLALANARHLLKMRPRVSVYALCVAAIGVVFEWIAIGRVGFFSHLPCPRNVVCLGSPVPILWLSMLYVSGAIAIHRLIVQPLSNANRTRAT